ncbi:hypothetical protein [Actinophytocola sp. KF-1]
MLDTKIKGNPGSLHALADWLRDTLADEVHTAVTQAFRARTNTEADWTGPAAEAFRGRMTTGGKKADEVADDAKTGFKWAERAAADLESHKRRMDAVRADAQKAGLTVVADGIVEPGAAPAKPQAGATQQQVQDYNTAAAAHGRQVAAYNKAKADIDKIRNDMSAKEMTVRNFLDDLIGKAPFNAAALANDSYIGYVMGKRAQKYLGRQQSLMNMAEKYARSHPTNGSTYRGHGGDLQRDIRVKQGLAHQVRNAGGKAIRAGRVVPVVGAAISAGVLWWDLEHGKPPTKAITSAVVSTAAGMGGGAIIGGAVGGTFGNVPGAIAGGVGGMVVGLGAGALYDTWWDKNVKGSDFEKSSDKWIKDTWHKIF